MQIADFSGLPWWRLSLAALSLTLLSLVAAGCGNDGSGGGDSAGPPAPLADGGVVRARAPIVGATVTAYKAGTSGYGLGAVVLATTKSDSHGNYSFASASCNTGDLIYYVASGGDAGAGVNPAIVLMSEVGTCGALPGFVVINEVHTAAAAYALAQFMGKSSPYRVGAPESNALGIRNAFATVGNLVSVGGAGARLVTPGGGTAPQRNLNTLANALAGCVNSSGPDSAECSELFACARPGASFETNCSGGSGATPADTLGAALNVALNPTSVSMAGLFDDAVAHPVFSPELASAPHDWAMPLRYAQPAAHFGFPVGVAIDRAGRVWVANSGDSSGLGSSVTALNNDGSLYGNFDQPGANFYEPMGVAIDGGGHVWVTNRDSVTALNNDGSLYGNFAPPGSNIDFPIGIATDSAGHVWVVNFNGYGSVTALNNDGSLYGNFAPPGANFTNPYYVAIDSAGQVWVTNRDSVIELVGVANPVRTPLAPGGPVKP